MNVNDVTQEFSGSGDRLADMLNRQKELMDKYHEIEAEYRLTTDCPVNLHDHYGQLLLKDFAWRSTEEMAEAIDALDDGDEDSILHAQEEVADSLHFLIELGLLAGITLDDFKDEVNSLSSRLEVKALAKDTLTNLFLVAGHKQEEGLAPNLKNFGQYVLGYIVSLGMMCHTLKNKPWKKTQVMTDVDLFKARYFDTFINLLVVSYWGLGMDAYKLHQMYFKKSEVNKFRQRSNY